MPLVRLGVPRTIFNGKEYYVGWSGSGLSVERGKFKVKLSHEELQKKLAHTSLAGVLREVLLTDHD